MLVRLVEAYTEAKGADARVEVLLSPDDQKALKDEFLAALSEAVRKGVELRGDKGVLAGFRVSVSGENLSHDFSRDAIVDALCAFLWPQIAELLRSGTGAPAEQ